MNDIFSNSFRKKYPWPSDLDIESLFRFYSYDTETKHYHQSLLTKGMLHHNLPSNFNDPFECRPNVQWPSNEEEMKALIEDVETLIYAEGHSIEKATTIAQSFIPSEQVKEEFLAMLHKQFQSFRLCCFTKSKDNLLFWAHYANSHKGYCVEFSTKGKVLAQTYKVKYSKCFPQLKFPLFSDLRIITDNLPQLLKLQDPSDLKLNLYPKLIEPVLNKSLDWKYEDEYRSVLKPNAPMQLSNDNESLHLEAGDITNIYFGLYMDEDHKKDIVELVKEGIFTPKFWNAKMKSDHFSLYYEEY